MIEGNDIFPMKLIFHTLSSRAVFSDFATKVECQLAIDSFDSVNEVDMVRKAIPCFDISNN